MMTEGLPQLNRLIILSLMFVFINQWALYGETSSSERTTKKVTETELANVKVGLDLPKNLDQALIELKQMLDPEFIQEFKNAPESSVAIRYHFSLGLWMRENWGLQQGSPLSKFFKELGIYSPEGMSSLILVAFWRRVNHQPINLEEMSSIIYWKKYWENE